MAQTDVAIRKAKPAPKSVKLSDGGGMHLLVTPAGVKLWRLKYRIDGREKLVVIGDVFGDVFGTIDRVQSALANCQSQQQRQLPTQRRSLAAPVPNVCLRRKPPCRSRGRVPPAYDRSSVESGVAGSPYLPHQELSMLHGDMAMSLR